MEIKGIIKFISIGYKNIARNNIARVKSKIFIYKRINSKTLE